MQRRTGLSGSWQGVLRAETQNVARRDAESWRWGLRERSFGRRVGRRLGVRLSLGLIPVLAVAAGAQQRGTAPRTPRSAVVLPAGPADTAMVSGRQSFAAYRQPVACLRAATAVEEGAHFADEDTAYWADPKGDTLATATVAMARRCGAAFTAENIPAGELLDLMHLALMAGDDARAQAAAARYLAGVPAAPAHSEAGGLAWALYAVDTTYLSAKPKRLAAAEAVTARLDSMGAAAAMQRNKAHGDLMGIARERFDTTRLEREALALITAASQTTAADREVWDNGGSAVPGVTMVWVMELYQDPTGAMERTKAKVLAAGLLAAEWDLFLVGMRGLRLDWMATQIGKPVPPLKAQYWAGADSAHRVWPVPGTVSVYLQAMQVKDTNPVFMEVEAVHMSMWRRFLKKYGPALEVTVLAASQGSFRSGPPLSPGEEAERIAKFYREELGVPVTVALQETPVKQLPDGRKIRGKAPFESDPYYGMKFILADKAGKLVLAAHMGEPVEEPILDAWLAREVRR